MEPPSSASQFCPMTSPPASMMPQKLPPDVAEPYAARRERRSGIRVCSPRPSRALYYNRDRQRTAPVLRRGRPVRSARHAPCLIRGSSSSAAAGPASDPLLANDGRGASSRRRAVVTRTSRWRGGARRHVRGAGDRSARHAGAGSSARRSKQPADGSHPSDGRFVRLKRSRRSYVRRTSFGNVEWCFREMMLGQPAKAGALSARAEEVVALMMRISRQNLAAEFIGTGCSSSSRGSVNAMSCDEEGVASPGRVVAWSR